jgi:CTP:molybdopterin cytidylyltransferase MocA
MGQPKASLPFRGATFLSTVVRAAREAGLDPIVVVLGADGDKILLKHELDGCLVAWNPDTEAGPIASIQAGISKLNHLVEAVLIWHVDRPHVRPTTVALLVDAFRASGCAIVIPSCAGRRGHPVVFARPVFEELLAVPPGQGARVVVRKDPARVRVVPTDDPAVLEDVNLPEEYRRLLEKE